MRKLFLSLAILLSATFAALGAEPPSPSSNNRYPDPVFKRGRVFQDMQTPPTQSFGGFVYQNKATAASDILGPQQPPGWFTVDGIRSVIDVPAGSSAQTTSAFGFYAINRSPGNIGGAAGTGVTGVFGTTACVVDNSECWGFNPTVIDAPANGVVTNGVGRILVGSELDVQVTSPNTIVSGYNCTGASIAQPAGADCFQVGNLAAGNPGLGIKWSHGVTVGDATSTVALQIGADALAGANVAGIPNHFNYRDSAGLVRALRLQASGGGAFNFSRVDGGNGIALIPAVPGASPQLVSFGSDANVGMNFSLQGTGTFGFNSPTQFNSPVTLSSTTATTLAAPVKLPVYPVASLPTCNTALRGALAAVNNAASPVYGAAITGGGTSSILAFCDGSGWSAH